jgi:hypothetical protein
MSDMLEEASEKSRRLGIVEQAKLCRGALRVVIEIEEACRAQAQGGRRL